MDPSKIFEKTWSDLISADINLDFEFLALKILLSRLRLKIKLDSSPENLRDSVEELKNLFIRFQNLPVAQRDLQKILEKQRSFQ